MGYSEMVKIKGTGTVKVVGKCSGNGRGNSSGKGNGKGGWEVWAQPLLYLGIPSVILAVTRRVPQ